MRARAVLAAAVLGAAAVAGPVAASFAEAEDAATGTLTGDVLSAPTLLAAAPSCKAGPLGLLGNTPVVTLTWTPAAALATSTSTLRGQAVSVVVGAEVRAALTSAPVTASSADAEVHGYVDGSGTARPLADGTSYAFQVRTLWGSWTSPAASVSRTTAVCL